MMEAEKFVQKKCNSGKNIQFQPKGFLRLQLEKIVPLLEELGAETEVETPSLLIFRFQGMQIDLNASGKTVLKTEDWDKAKECFLLLLPAISKSAK